MAAPFKISARVEIDASQAKVGARDAADAVQSITPAADQASAGLSKVAAASANLPKAGDAAQQVAKGLSSIEPAAKQAETAIQRLINASVGLHSGPANQNAREWAGALAAQGMELDRLRAKYNPLFAVISAYKQSLTEIRTANAMGAISNDEMTAAISRQRQATLGLIDVIKGRNKALAETPAHSGGYEHGGAAAFQTANIAAQFQDIGVTAAMGMAPLQIGLQQGTQLAGVFAQMGSGRQVVAGLAAAFTSLVSPVSLITIGLTAGTAALVQYFTSASSGAEKTNGLLAEQADIIKQAAQSWGDALPSVKAYADQVERAKKNAEGQEAGRILGGRALDGLDEEIKKLNPQFTAAMRSLQGLGADPAFIRDFSSAFGTLRERLDEGTASIEDVSRAQKELTFAVGSYGTRQVLSFRDAWDQVTIALRAGIAEAKKAREEWLTTVAGGTNVQDIVAGASFTTEDGKTRQTSTFTPKVGPMPTSRPLIELDGLPGEAKKEETQAEKARKAYADLIKSADDRIVQMKLEAGLAGETGIAVDTLRFRLELLQKLEDGGAKATPEQLKALDEKAAAYRKYAEAAAEAGLRAKLEFEREQLGRTAVEQDIANQQRAAGLAVNMNSYEAALIRANERMKESKEIAGDFVKTLIGGLRDGKDLWDALGNAALNVLSKIAQKMLEDQIASMFGGGAAGASSGGGIGSISGFIQGLFKQTGAAAPAAANLNAPSGSGEALAWSFWKSKGLADHQVAGILGHIKGESSFNPLAVGDGGKAFGLYQHNDRAPSLLAAIGGKGNLGDELAQHRFAYQELMGPENRSWQALLASKDVRGATSAFAGFERPSGFSWANPEGSHNFAGRLAGAEDALRKFGGTAGLATRNLGGFGAGLGKMGQSLTNIFPAAPSAPGGGGFMSGIGGFFSSLFGGTPAGPQASFLLSGGGVPGLFDKGGFTGDHAVDKIAGFVHGREFVVNAEATAKPGVRSFLQALNDNRLHSLQSGGFVGPAIPGPGAGTSQTSGNDSGMKVFVNNYGGAKVETREETGQDGQRSLFVELDKHLASLLQDDASRTSRAMKNTYGAARKVERK